MNICKCSYVAVTDPVSIFRDVWALPYVLTVFLVLLLVGFIFAFGQRRMFFRCGTRCFLSTQCPFTVKLGLRSSYCAYTPKNKNNQKTSLWWFFSTPNLFLSTCKHTSEFLLLVVEQMFGVPGSFAVRLFITSDTNLLHVDQLRKKNLFQFPGHFWEILLLYSLIFQDFPSLSRKFMLCAASHRLNCQHRFH